MIYKQNSTINHPYFNEIKFKLSNDIIVNAEGREVPDPARSIYYREAMDLAYAISEALLPGSTNSY